MKPITRTLKPQAALSLILLALTASATADDVVDACDALRPKLIAAVKDGIYRQVVTTFRNRALAAGGEAGGKTCTLIAIGDRTKVPGQAVPAMALYPEPGSELARLGWQAKWRQDEGGAGTKYLILAGAIRCEVEAWSDRQWAVKSGASPLYEITARCVRR